jgi:hypothetical protein
MKNSHFFFYISLLFFAACDNTASKTGTAGAGDTASVQPVYVTKKVSDIEPRLGDSDSLEVLYYDNPDGDSLRYTRYFTYTETKDSALVKSLVTELDQVYTQELRARRCRSEGKLYLLKGENILKTIYFSSRGDSCTYFYFIKDGAFIYLPLTKTAEEILKKNKQKARKPAGNINA